MQQLAVCLSYTIGQLFASDIVRNGKAVFGGDLEPSFQGRED
jgi:hypothetical protein